MSVVGIDLGTTNTVVACVRGGKVHVLADEAGSRLLPSVVSFHPNGEVLVGPPAKLRRVIDPKHTIANHKRIIGHSWNSPELVEARQRAPFELREGPGQGALVHVRGQDYTLPEISAFVLKRARQIAETALGEPVERAVITVPAHFNELQRASTKVAGRISGVEVMRILNEPTAAALAYGLGRGGAERVAIYDFGGGTFDCTLLDLNGNVFEVLASAGDSFLGGDDADAAIAERMADYILKQYRYDARTDKQAFERLKVAGETVKMTLSTKEEATIKLDDVGFGVGGAPLNVTFTLKRKEFEQLIIPLVERSFKVTQDALSLARLSPSAFDRVILVGGSTRIPLVRARVEAFFGGKPMDKLNPDEVVAVGAAIQAAALVDAGRRREIPAPPALPGTAPKTMRGTGPGGRDFDDSDSTESNTLAKGDGPPVGGGVVTASGATTQRKGGTWPPGQSAQQGQRPVPGRSSPPGKASQPPGKISQPPEKFRSRRVAARSRRDRSELRGLLHPRRPERGRCPRCKSPALGTPTRTRIRAFRIWTFLHHSNGHRTRARSRPKSTPKRSKENPHRVPVRARSLPAGRRRAISGRWMNRRRSTARRARSPRSRASAAKPTSRCRRATSAR